MAEQRIGKITHYFTKAGVAVIAITDGELNVGEMIHIQGHTSDFTQKVDSMQIDQTSVDSAKAGEEIGVKVVEPARENDAVYRVIPD